MTKNRFQMIFTILMLLFFIYTAFEATSFKKQASYFPLYISIIGIVGMVLEIVRQLVDRKKPDEKRNETLHPNLRGVIIYTGILTAYVVLVYIIGLILATVIFLFLFLYFIAKMKLWRTVLSVGILITLVTIFGNVMNLYWPKSLFNILVIML